MSQQAAIHIHVKIAIHQWAVRCGGLCRHALDLGAGRGTRQCHAPRAEAMAELCRLYWYPLYAYVRRRGHDIHDAEDLTQEFFLRLLAKESLAGIDREKGKFRAFLLATLKHFLANQWDRARRKSGAADRPFCPSTPRTPKIAIASSPGTI